MTVKCKRIFKSFAELLRYMDKYPAKSICYTNGCDKPATCGVLSAVGWQLSCNEHGEIHG